MDLMENVFDLKKKKQYVVDTNTSIYRYLLSDINTNIILFTYIGMNLLKMSYFLKCEYKYKYFNILFKLYP